MSYASEHPVHCARRDEGCEASVPGSRWDQVKASREGWFFSQQDDLAYCPEHVPDWVPAWRQRKAEQAKRSPRVLRLADDLATATAEELNAVLELLAPDGKASLSYLLKKTAEKMQAPARPFRVRWQQAGSLQPPGISYHASEDSAAEKYGALRHYGTEYRSVTMERWVAGRWEKVTEAWMRRQNLGYALDKPAPSLLRKVQRVSCF